MQSYVRKVVIWFAVCSSAYLSVLVWLEITRRITPVDMAYASLGLWIGGAIVLTILFRRAQKKYPKPNLSTDAVAAKRLRVFIVICKVCVGLLAIGLIVGLASFRRDEVGPNIVGIAINQIFMWSLIVWIRKLQVRLRQ